MNRTKMIDPHWCLENPERAANRIEELEKSNDKMRDILNRSLLNIYGDTWREDASAALTHNVELSGREGKP